MSDKGKIILQGQGPFHLPIAQRATAIGDKNNGVTMMLWAVFPERGPQPESVSAQMLSKTARPSLSRLDRGELSREL
jgi:hypothetical protein